MREAKIMTLKIIKILLWMYLFFLPLMNLPKPLLLGTKIQYCDIVFIFLFIIWFFVMGKFSFPLQKNIKYSLSMIVVINLFSCLNSRNLSVSVINYVGFLYLVVLFFLLVAILKDLNMFNMVIQIIFLSSIITSVIGIGSFILYLTGNTALTKSFLFFTPLKASVVPLPRLCSTFVSPEMFITFSQLGLVCGIIKIELMSNPIKRRLAFFGVLIILIAVSISYSRSLTGLFLAMSLILLVKKNIKFLMPLRLAVTILFIILFCAAILTSIWIIYPISISHDADAELTTVAFRTSPDMRSILQSAAVRIAIEKPFFGIGQGMFTYQLKNYIDFRLARHTIKINDFRSLEIDPHSTYFGALAETGFLGLTSMLILFGAFLKSTIISLKEAQASKYKIVKFYLFASFVGYLLTACFVDIFAFRHFWINLSLLVSCGNIDTNNG